MPKKSKHTPHLRIRIEPELLARLEKSRKAQGRTLTGEIVHKIEQSFRKSEDADLAAETFRAALGGPTGDLLRAFLMAILLLEKRTGKKWNEDRDTAFQVRPAIGAEVERFVLKALQKMGSDAEIAEAGKKIEARTRKADNKESEQ